ncbi:response regulator [Paenibacillus sp. GCM10023252]|uniref:response regulator transcription factor n=1 Tax=Paenibacillus sp. GCM10023252 TaxID=3252649 RepID=UPI0036110E65
MIRVLIVDDAPVIRESVSVAVEECADTIIVAGQEENGLSALAWLEENYADLCITDIRMPIMDGLQLIREINDRYPWMKCMVVSSYDDFQYAKQSIQLNAIDYILKPIDEDLLYDALMRAQSSLTQERNRMAADLILRKLPHHHDMMNRWLDQIRTLNAATLPLLIVDTLDMLEHWVEGEYYRLNALSNLWLRSIIEELTTEQFTLELDEGKDLGLGEATLPVSRLRSYFRLCAVRRLEEGAYRLMDTMRGARDQPTIKAIGQIKRYIAEHYCESINLQDLADQVAMNKSYMCTLFKQETEMTIWSYIVGERMRKARDMLLQTKDRIYEIAGAVGYEDVAYFSQLFKKHYGMTPNDYKRRMDA